MSLKNEEFNIYYNTDENDINLEFYNKALKHAVTYRRASAFFSSSSLLVISRGIEELIENEGKMELLISPNLSHEDIEAIDKGYKSREQVIEDKMLCDFKIDNSNYNQYNYLAWLIYENKLEVRIVVRKDMSRFGIFHDKFGIVEDQHGNKIAFHGSMNESETAFIDNYESINVFLSWEKRDERRIENCEKKFFDIWNNNSNNWITLEFPDAVRKAILSIRSQHKPIKYKCANEELILKEASIPYGLEIREYQKEAIKKWFENRGNGIFEMATGTGKTITSICAMVKLLGQFRKNTLPCGLIIVVPYKILLEQWVEVLEKFNIFPIKCYENKEFWLEKLEDQVIAFNSGVQKNLFVITTNASFRGGSFQIQLNKITSDYIFCIDEMHHFATANLLEKLPVNCKFKLGLSATLTSKYDEQLTNKLIDYFENGIIFNFPMERAISENFLTPYYYYPVFVELTDEEKDEYTDVTLKICKLYSDKNRDEDMLQGLLMKRARIIASASNKINKLIEMKEIIKNNKYSIFYCGDKIESDEKFIHKVNKALAFDVGIKTHTFTSQESKREREQILKDFINGNIDALTAIRCLDEGVDIPKLTTAFILSSGTNPKEFIQRRGRILRKFKGKEYSVIYDFIVIPTLNENILSRMSPEEKRAEQKIIFREYERFKEFANLAINKYEAYNLIVEKWNKY